MCQGPKTAAGDVRRWVNTLALTLMEEGSKVENATALYHVVKYLTVEELQIYLLALPRNECALGTRPHQTATQYVTEGLVAVFYADLYQTVARDVTNAFCDRSSTNNLEIVDLLRRLLEDSAMTMAELTKVAKFYETDFSLYAVWHERNNWFKRCSLLGDVPSIKSLREKLAEEEAFKFMMPYTC